MLMRGARVPLGVQELFCLHVLRGGRYYADVPRLLRFKQQFVVDGYVPDSKIVECLAISHHNRDQVPCERFLSAPRLPEAKHYVGLRGLATPLGCILKRGCELVWIIEDFSPFFLLEDVCVFERGRAVIDDCPTQGPGVDTLVLHLQDQTSLEVREYFFGEACRVTRGEGDLLGFEGAKQFLLDLGF